jgi:hypothetical protein
MHRLQQYGIDYEETFSTIAKMNSIWMVLAMATHMIGTFISWMSNQHSSMIHWQEEVYMEQQPSLARVRSTCYVG